MKRVVTSASLQNTLPNKIMLKWIKRFSTKINTVDSGTTSGTSDTSKPEKWMSKLFNRKKSKNSLNGIQEPQITNKDEQSQEASIVPSNTCQNVELKLSNETKLKTDKLTTENQKSPLQHKVSFAAVEATPLAANFSPPKSERTDIHGIPANTMVKISEPPADEVTVDSYLRSVMDQGWVRQGLQLSGAQNNDYEPENRSKPPAYPKTLSSSYPERATLSRGLDQNSPPAQNFHTGGDGATLLSAIGYSRRLSTGKENLPEPCTSHKRRSKEGFGNEVFRRGTLLGSDFNNNEKVKDVKLNRSATLAGKAKPGKSRVLVDLSGQNVIQKGSLLDQAFGDSNIEHKRGRKKSIRRGRESMHYDTSLARSNASRSSSKSRSTGMHCDSDDDVPLAKSKSLRISNPKDLDRFQSLHRKKSKHERNSMLNDDDDDIPLASIVLQKIQQKMAANT
jgi:hypothetical protein